MDIKKMLTPSIKQSILLGLLAITIIFTVFSNHNHVDIRKALKSDNELLNSELDIFKSINDSLKISLADITKQYNTLVVEKSKVHIEYETRIKEVSNSRIISNDSIVRYISKKIHNR